MKRKIARFLEAAIFCALMFAVIAGLSGVLERKESRQKLGPFFERAPEIDVLFFGSSHVLCGVYPMELWHDYGITSYNFGNYNNTVPMSYWVLQSALDVCSPKLVVLDVDEVGHMARLSERAGDVHTTLDGLPLNLTKMRAIEDLMDDPTEIDDYGQPYRDMKWEYYFPLMLYHERWDSLTRDDLFPQGNAQLGASMLVNVAQPAEYAIPADALEEEGWGFVYLRRLMAECRERGIDVLLVNLPYPSEDGEAQRYANRVYVIAEECGVDFVDFVYLDQIVDYATDCYDPASHLNPSGARKVTDFLGEYIAGRYGVPDHRDDARYASWDAEYEAYQALKIQQLGEQTDPANFLMLLHDSSLSACVSVPEGSALYRDENLMRLLQNVGRRHLFNADTEEAVWADGLFPLEALDGAAQSGARYLAAFDRNAIWEAANGESGDFVGSFEASFGRIAPGEGAAVLLTRDGETIELFSEDYAEGADLCAAVFDARTGELLMTRALRGSGQEDGEAL